MTFEVIGEQMGNQADFGWDGDFQGFQKWRDHFGYVQDMQIFRIWWGKTKGKKKLFLEKNISFWNVEFYFWIFGFPLLENLI